MLRLASNHFLVYFYMGLNSLEQDLFCLAREDLEKYVLGFLSNSTFINSFDKTIVSTNYDKTKFLLVCLFVSFCFFIEFSSARSS